MMSQQSPSRDRKLRTTSCIAFAYGAALFAACAADGDAFEPARREQHLIGGSPVTADFFRSTVGISDDCTAAKVGPRLFLTAAHCVALGRPGRGEEVPEDFPPNDGVRAAYLPGERLRINWGLDADDADQADFTIVATSIHPSWWQCPLCQDPILAQGGAADIAVVEIAEDTPQIPAASVELGTIAPGARVFKVGWGCEERTNIDPTTLQLGRYKADDAVIIPGSEIRHHESPITDGQVVTVDASYLITAGRSQGEGNASLCLGDSGGPLYLADGGAPRIVGVNSNYTFPPSSGPDDLGGVSWTDWHTRTSLESLHDVGQWLVDLGVNTVGGGTATADCTCPRGCDAVEPARVPFMLNGPDDTCYFFDALGFSVNSHSMARVNLNGQDITNRWVGNGSYPPERDGGYYLYLQGQKAWSWAQATN